MKQTFTINARRVEISNIDRRPSRGKIAQLTRELRSSGESIAATLERSNTLVELLNRDHERRDDVVVHVAPTPERPLDVVDRAGLVHDGIDVLTEFQEDSSLSDTAPSPEAAPIHTQPRVEVVASVPSGATAAAVFPSTAAAPRLYYQDRLITLYHGDCLADPSLWTVGDVLVTDPPYGLQALAGAYGFSSSKRGSVTIANDLDTTHRDRVLELWGDKPAAVFGTPRLPDPPGEWADRLVWDKQQLGLNGGAWRYAHESIFVRGDGWRRLSDASSSILRHSSQANRRFVAKHIHSKPEKLCADIIAAAPEGVIVDTFAGGGAVVAAAAALNRQIIAFELEEEYCEEIVQRVSSRIDLGGNA